MNRRGFTLVEVLAIIVILTVIASIATPIIFNIIGDSKESALKTSMNGIKKAIEQDYGDNGFNATTIYYYGGFNGTNYAIADSTKNLVAHPTSGSTRDVAMAGAIQGKGKAQMNTSDGTIEIVIFTTKFCGILIGNSEVKTKKISNSYKAQDCINDFDTKKGF